LNFVDVDGASFAETPQRRRLVFIA